MVYFMLNLDLLIIFITCQATGGFVEQEFCSNLIAI